MLRRRALCLPLSLAVAALLGPGLSPRPAAASPPEDKPKSASGTPPATPSWMVSFEASPKQKMGMEPSDVQAFLDKQLKSQWKQKKTWQDTWEKVFLLMTPEHEVEVPAFALSKYEVTNAQWEEFLQDRTEKMTTAGDETLAGLAASLWHFEDTGRESAEITRGWRTLLALNAAVLMPLLNPEKKAKWDAQEERAEQQKLPAGLELTYPRYPIAPHWKDGKLPAEERRLPMRFLSWEQCVDFCEWAGFHLPTEEEWERAARGTEGRWFPWGNEWDGTRAVWLKFNEAAIAAKKAGGTVEPLKQEPPQPVAVDTFPQGATPEGILHMIGNVGEFVANRNGRYPKSTTAHKGLGMTQVVRGGNFEDEAEVLLAADRNTDSLTGWLAACHSQAGYGFRLAAYPVAGADVAASVFTTWSEKTDPSSPAYWLPPAPGMPDRKKSEPYLGFAVENTAGVLERSLGDGADHVFVTGAARGVALLPVKGVPYETVKGIADFSRYAGKTDVPVLLGLLVGTSNLATKVQVPTSGGSPEEAKVAFRDPARLRRDADRRYTGADLGLMLVLDGEKVLVYAPDSSVAGAEKYRNAPLGFLAESAKWDVDKDNSPSSGVIESEGDKNTAVLTARIPLLTKEGTPHRGAPSIRVTIRVPIVPR